MLSDILASDPDLEIAGTAATGKIALAKIPQINPDLVTLDVEMPEMDGLQTLAAIRKSYPLLPVIMFSTLTDRGAASTLDALALGATDYVTKPANVGSVSIAQQRIREQLIPKIKMFCGRSAGIPVTPVLSKSAQGIFVPQEGAKSWGGRKQPPSRIDIVAIGVSTGGPNALAVVLPNITPNFPVPIVIVQHMPPTFTRFLATRLASQTSLKIAEGVNGGKLEPGNIWIAPGDFHMVVSRNPLGDRVRLNQELPENSCRPAVDVLFRSVAECYGPHALAVVLTGMGQDGLRGCKAIAEVGGQILAQDEASSVVWGMPGFVARAGLADRVLPLNQLGPEIIRRVYSGASAVSGRV
jgi:two-component system chemotaxis response regulator CheB